MADFINNNNVIVTPKKVEQVGITLETYFAFKDFDSVEKASKTFLAEQNGTSKTWRTFDEWEKDFVR